MSVPATDLSGCIAVEADPVMIEKLELLLALARERHFGRAAESCNISQPTLSAAIKSIEEQLGVRIVVRASRFHGFTPEGERVLEWARRIVGDARTMRQEINALKRELAGHLQIGVIPTALPFVPDLTMNYSSRFSNVSVSVMSMASDAILSSLDNLEIDAGISYIDTEPLQRFQVVPLYEERYALLVAPESPLANAEKITWADAAKLPLCLLTPDMQNRRIIDRHIMEAGGSAAVRFESNSMTMLHVHVRSGAWSTIAALGEGSRFDPPFGLKAIPITGPTVTHKIGLILKVQEPQTPLVQAFLKTVEPFAQRAGAGTKNRNLTAVR
jgi:DNA-binding transcriptional LysR family regulator